MNNFQNSTWVFSNDNSDFLYRAVPPSRMPHIRKFIKHKVIGCAETTEHINVGKHDCILFKIDRLPFQIRIQELPRSMALEITMYLIDLVLQCLPDNIIPYDTTESNVLYWNSPVFVDLDSVAPLNKKYAIGTMAKMAYLYNKYVRRMKFKAVAGSYNMAMIQAHGGPFSVQRDWELLESWQQLRDSVRSTKIIELHTNWADKYGPHYTNPDKMKAENAKIAGALKLIEMARPESMLDVGCNKGYLCSMASGIVKNATGFDIDERCISIANEFYKDNHKINFANFGIMYLGDNLGFKQSRYAADMVVALAVTHHFKNAGLVPGAVASIIGKLAKRWILIEDIAETPKYHAVFQAAGFKLVEKRPSQPPSRTLSLFKR